MNFYKPTKTYKEMLVLEHINRNEKLTQKELAELTGSSVTMINQYIDELDENNYITRNYISAKVVRYYITDKGFKYSNYLKIKYAKELMDQYKVGQRIVSKFLKSLVNDKFQTIILYGAGNVSEIFIDIILKDNLSLSVIAMVDDDVSKIGTKMNNIPIVSIDEIDHIKHDGLIITTYAHEAKILKQLNSINYPKENIIKYFEKEIG